MPYLALAPTAALAGCGSSGSSASETKSTASSTHRSSTGRAELSNLGTTLAHWEAGHPKGSCTGCYGEKIPVYGTPTYECILVTEAA
jgi:hypothetical protein